MGLLGFFSRRAPAGSLRRNACRPRHRLARLEPLEQRRLLSVTPGFNNLNTAAVVAGSFPAALMANEPASPAVNTIQPGEGIGGLPASGGSGNLSPNVAGASNENTGGEAASSTQGEQAALEWLHDSVLVGVWTQRLITDLPAWGYSQQWPEWMDDLSWEFEAEELIHIPLQFPTPSQLENGDPGLETAFGAGFRTILRLDGGVLRVSVDEMLADLEQLDFVDFAKLESESAFRYTDRLQESIDAITDGNYDGPSRPRLAVEEPQAWLYESVRVSVWTPELIADLPGWVHSQDWPEWMTDVWVEGQPMEEMGAVEVYELVHMPLWSDPRGGYRTILRIDGGFRGVTVDGMLADLEQLDFVDYAKLEAECSVHYSPRVQELIDATTLEGSQAPVFASGPGATEPGDARVKPLDMRVTFWTEERISHVAAFVDAQPWPEAIGPIDGQWVEQLVSIPVRSEPRGGYFTIVRMDIFGDVSALDQVASVENARLEAESSVHFDNHVQQLIDATTMDGSKQRGEKGTFYFLPELRARDEAECPLILPTLYDSAADDVFDGDDDLGWLYGGGFDTKAFTFAVGQAIAEEREDDDTATVSGTPLWMALGDWEN
ncbi:MAG: hypothetical protein ABIK89_23630 [Planctomycetota bacterium]